MMILTSVDNCIIAVACMKDIDSFIFSMKHDTENFILTDNGDVNFFLGIKITQNEDSSFELSQPFLVDRLLSFLGLCNNEYQMDADKSATPVAKGLLHQDLASKPRKLSWKYRTAVGILSYLQGYT